MTDPARDLRDQIRGLVRAYHGAAFPPQSFDPHKSRVPFAGRVFDAEELELLVDASLDFWLTAGRFARQFEEDLGRYLGLDHVVLVNSGSSANLLALSCLTSPSLGDRQLQPGDEVITLAAGFPTTVNPIIQNRLTPVFVDVEIPTYNVRVDLLEQARSNRTKAIILAHTLGNPFNLEAVTAFARRHNLWLIEDCCDALGSDYAGRKAGTFGDLATFSFYPAHHITTGEGGAVATANPQLRRLVESFRDWGRDCWCPPGQDNTCGRRFDWKLGDLPFGFDHKYTYSHVGYNLKMTDMQAAVGVAQMRKLPDFVAARRRNFQILSMALADLEDHLILPQATPRSDPSWFGFPISVRNEAPFTRTALTEHLESRRIQTRLLFGANLTRQPAYQGQDFRVSGELTGSDLVTNQVFWIGVYPGLSQGALDHLVETIRHFVTNRGAAA